MAEHVVTPTTTATRPTAVVAQATTWEAFPRLWSGLLDEVYSVINRDPHRQARAGRERWQNIMLYKDDVPHVEVGVLISGPFAPSGRVLPSTLPGGETAFTLHRGPYDELDAAHQAVRDWCAASNRDLAGPRWEIYGHWEDDLAAPETEIYYLLR